MATVGSLFINVKARTAGFSKKMKGVRATIGRLGTGLAKAGKKLALFGAAMGAVALGAITMLTKKGLAAVDTMAKLAQNIGASVKSIQSLRHMATLGGVSVEKMDKAVSKMVRGIGESAVFGIGEANDAFRELGLSAKELEKDSPDVAFGKIADAINNVAGKARQGILAYKVFGRAGQELITTISGGSAAVDAMNNKLERLGVVIGDEQAQMVEKANDAWADIGMVWSGLGNQLAVNFAPILEQIANRIIHFVEQAGGMGQVAEFIVKAFMFAGAGILDVIKGINLGFSALKTGVLQVASDIVRIMAWAAENIEESFNTIKGLHEEAISLTNTLIADVAGGLSKGAGGLGLEDLELELSFWQRGSDRAARKGARNAAKIYNQEINKEISSFIKSMGVSLGNQSAEEAEKLLSAIAKGWNVGKVPQAFEDMIAKHLGEGFKKADTSGLQLEAPDLKGVINNLQTAIGGFKVEGDRTQRLQQEQLSVEKNQLRTLEQMKNAMALGALI